MGETRIEADVVYDHERYGEVLVTGIAQMYDEWDVSGPNSDIDAGEVFVYFHSRFDGYGGIATPETENVNDFAKAASRKHLFYYENVSDLQVDKAIDRIRKQQQKRDYSDMDPEEYTEDN